MPYLLTFSTYGTHLPGNENGSVDRLRRNHQRGGYQSPCRPLEVHASQLMPKPEHRLTQEEAELVLQAITEVCQQRNWPLLAAHVRTTHVHLIADDLPDPHRAITDFKAYATRALRERNHQPHTRYWARGGFAQWLRTTEARRNAAHYVLHRQGQPMASFPPIVHPT